MMTKARIPVLFTLLLVASCQPAATDEGQDTTDGELTEVAEAKPAAKDTITYEYASFPEALTLFQDLNYTPEAWQSGIREIPNMRFVRIPKRWRDSVAQKIEVKLKKQIFFRVIAPLALAIHDDIKKDREKLLAIAQANNTSRSEEDQEWLARLGKKYKVISDGQEVTKETIDELVNRVDIIPTSLALAQSAEESGWGTSRFANEGNALFGQWSWSANAIRPEQQRSGMGNYGIARFETPLESMRAYMLNLNTHNSYRELRKYRAELRAQGKEPDGPSLASTLTRYSEKGQEYVDNLQKMMRVNRLTQADSAYLKTNPVIVVIPNE